MVHSPYTPPTTARFGKVVCGLPVLAAADITFPSYNDVRGKMLGIIDCPEMKGVECNHEHLDEYAHDQPGNFRYVPNVSSPSLSCGFGF